MPSWTDTSASSGSSGAASSPTVRPARFDRPLAGPAAARQGGAWGDPALDAAVADVLARAREEGLAQGYAAGWAAGRQAAEERAQADAAEHASGLAAERAATLARATALLDALAAAAARRAAEPTWAELADVLADGALAIARAALGRELESVDGEVAARVRAALAPIAGDGRAVLRLAPADAAALEAGLASGPLPDGVVLVADPAVEPGTVVAQTETQRLRIDVPAAVAAAEAVLRS